MHRLDATQYDILYFTEGTAPTEEDYQNLAAIEGASRAHRVKFRNGNVGANDSLEICRGVAGPAIPERYLREYPTVDNSGNWSEPQPEPKASKVPIPVSAKVASEVGTVPQQAQEGDAGNGFFSSGFHSGS